MILPCEISFYVMEIVIEPFHRPDCDLERESCLFLTSSLIMFLLSTLTQRCWLWAVGIISVDRVGRSTSRTSYRRARMQSSLSVRCTSVSAVFQTPSSGRSWEDHRKPGSDIRSSSCVPSSRTTRPSAGVQRLAVISCSGVQRIWRLWNAPVGI